VNTDSAYRMKRCIILVSQVMPSNSYSEILAGEVDGKTNFCGASYSLEARLPKLANVSYLPRLFSFTNRFQHCCVICNMNENHKNKSQVDIITLMY
jgi:hypothetical protein